MEIRNIILEIPEVSGIYGFGSFFRGDIFRDVDLLFRLNCERDKIAETLEIIEREMERVGRALHVKFDITALTDREFKERPLLEMETLIRLDEA